jgi:hypothetical protein
VNLHYCSNPPYQAVLKASERFKIKGEKKSQQNCDFLFAHVGGDQFCLELSDKKSLNKASLAKWGSF